MHFEEQLPAHLQYTVLNQCHLLYSDTLMAYTCRFEKCNPSQARQQLNSCPHSDCLSYTPHNSLTKRAMDPSHVPAGNAFTLTDTVAFISPPLYAYDTSQLMAAAA